ncbi:hypothetical protein [Actinoplanes sp. TFC3]|uniref:hypothetical protein n=1 Tax=Actinoplanes sp. TFC3 TaxID=1710355 RepID=UPI000B0ECEE8|nr:hypothetical protein [Actinoplanes sp. TFC3]
MLRRARLSLVASLFLAALLPSVPAAVSGLPDGTSTVAVVAEGIASAPAALGGLAGGPVAPEGTAGGPAGLTGGPLALGGLADGPLALGGRGAEPAAGEFAAASSVVSGTVGAGAHGAAVAVLGALVVLLVAGAPVRGRVARLRGVAGGGAAGPRAPPSVA